MKALGYGGNFFVRHRVAIAVIAVVILAGGVAACFTGCGPGGGDKSSGNGEKLDENEKKPDLVEKIVFDRGNAIWIMSPDGTAQAQLTSTGFNSYPSLSPDGKYIVFTRYDGDPNQTLATGAVPPTNELYIMNSDGTGSKRLSPADWATSKGWTPIFDIQAGTKWRRRNCIEPSFSSDGKSICFVVSDNAYQESPGGGMGNYGTGGIAVMELKGDEPASTDIIYSGKDLYGGESFGSPEFCEDGSHILFTYGTGGGPPGISVERIDADGKNRKAIFPCRVGNGTGPDKGYYAFDLSPDGRTMVCVELVIDQGKFKTWLFLADIDGSKRRNVPTDGVAVGTDRVSFSPDGLRIAFVRGAEGDTPPDAYVINADGNGMAQISRDVDLPDWGKTVK